MQRCGSAWDIQLLWGKEAWDWLIWPCSKDVGELRKCNSEEERKHGKANMTCSKDVKGLGKCKSEEERKHGTGQYDHAVKIWESLGNTSMRRKGSMGLSNMTMQRCRRLLGKYNYEEERQHGTGQLWPCSKDVREGLGNTIMRLKGSMGLVNLTMQ